MQPVQQVDTNSQAHGISVIAAATGLIRHHAGDRQPVPRLSSAARTSLAAYPWDAEMTGLEGCIKRALVLCDSDVIEPVHLGLTRSDSSESETRETAAILASLRAAGGQRATAAATLGIAPHTLRTKLADLRARGVPVPFVQPTGPGVRHD